MIEWNLANGWGTLKLGSIAPEENEQITPTDTPDITFNYWGLDAIQPGEFTEPAPNFVKGSEILSSCIQFSSNHILYAKLRPYLNKVIIPSIPGIGSTEWVVLNPNPSVINRQFLGYVLRTQKFVDYSSYHSAGGRMPRTKKSALRAAEIPIPRPDDLEKSLEAQMNIVSRIESLFRELDEAYRLHEKISADTNRLMDAVLAEYFPRFGITLPDGWEWKPISFLAQDTDRQNLSLTAPAEYFNYIDISSVDNAIGEVIDPKRLLGQDAPSRARKTVHTNDVIFATTRPYLKNIALIPPDLDQAICSTGFCVLVPKLDYCVPQYLFFAVRSESVIQQLIPKQRGASYPAVLDLDIFNSYIPVPYPGDSERSKATQDMAAKRISEMGVSISEAQKDNAKTKLLIDQMEQSILAQAFRGEL